jgi:hypothetical protein
LEHLKNLLDQVLADNLQDLVLLKHFTRNVEGQVFRVDNTLDEGEPFRNELLAVIHDEDAANVQLDVVALLLLLKHIEGSTLGDVENGTEFQLTFDGEVLDGQVVFPVVGEGLVECTVLLVGDVIRVAGPERLGL